MTRVIDIMRVLKREGLLVGHDVLELQAVHTVCEPGWPSSGGLAFAYAQPDHFCGDVILVPAEVSVPGGASVIQVTDPKTAWAVVVTELLPELWDRPEYPYQAGFGFVMHKGRPLRVPHCGGVRIGDRVEIGEHVCIDRGVIGDTVIGDDVKIDNLVHVAHNVRIGDGALITAGAILGGSCVIGERAFIGIGALIRNKIKIGNGVTVGMGAVVVKDVPEGATVVGNPARPL